MNYSEIKTVTEAERAAVEAALLERLGAEGPIATRQKSGRTVSPYAAETAIYGPETALEHGCRVSVAPVCKSYNGAGCYKNRGRWRRVFVINPNADGNYAVCKASDRDAEEVGEHTGYYVRPWTTHEAEEASGGLGQGASALADALAAVGL